MNEYIIGGPGGLVGFLQEMKFEEGDLGESWQETERLLRHYEIGMHGCCNEQKVPAKIAFHKAYRNIVDSKLDELGSKFLAKAKEKGYDSIRFIVDTDSYYKKTEKRNAVTYEKVLQ
jgi:hypothetical protein